MTGLVLLCFGANKIRVIPSCLSLLICGYCIGQQTGWFHEQIGTLNANPVFSVFIRHH